MAHNDVIAGPTVAGEPAILPRVRTIDTADLWDALARGFDDFRAMPTHVIFLGLLYPIVGLALGRAALGYEVLPLLYPLAAGFALLGPFAAVWLYELSRRREAGLDTSWKHAFDVAHSPSFGSILALGLLLTVIFVVWLAVAHAIYIANFGYREPASITGFLQQVLTTPSGHMLMIVGNLVGFCFALVVLAISAVSFPLLVDRNVGAVAAVTTSLEVVRRNPVVMAQWGLIVAVALLVGSLPLFFGLAVVVPVLGHATWHLYRKAVEPNPDPVLDRHAAPKGARYAAEFPAALFGRAGRHAESEPPIAPR
jgi:uncharacterized membrane protein